jgi:acyl carrier protein
MLPSVSEIFSEVLGVPAEEVGDDFSPATSPLWDSLQSMNLVMALEEAYSVRFSTKEISAMRSVGQVKDVLKKKGIETA